MQNYKDMMKILERSMKEKQKKIIKNIKIRTLINALHQNNSIEEISKITNLEIDYIKNIVKSEI